MHYFRPKRRIVLARPSYSVVYRLFGRLPRHREVRVPLGLLSIAGSLLDKGFEVHVVDGEPHLDSTRSLARKIMRLDPDFIGVTATTPEIDQARDLIRMIKIADPRVVTILGGAHASALPEQTLAETPGLDYLVAGEGERAIVEIVRHRPRERIIRLEPIQDLDTLPFPAKHLVNPADYRYPHPRRGMVTLDAVETSRGCPYNCIFCFHLNGEKTRFKSPARVLEELRRSRHQFGARMVMFFDDTFTLDNRRASRILQDVIDTRLDLQFHCFTRADTLNAEMIALMRAGGFAKVTMGVESGDQKMLDRLRKGTRLTQYRRAYALAYRAGLETRGSFMVGNPYESWQSVQASIDFARSLDLFRVGVNIATPYPGTALYHMAKTGNGIELVETDWRKFTRWGRSVVSTPEMTARELETAQLTFLNTFYSNAKVVRYHARRWLKGNRSLYYHRPFLWSLARRLKTPFRGRPDRKQPDSRRRAG